MLNPWQINDYKNLVKLSAKLPQAILLNSAKCIGAEELVLEFIAYLMCHNPNNGDACKTCSACLLFKDGSHPDYFLLDSIELEDKKSKSITVDQIRNMMDFIALSSHMGRYKIVFIRDTILLNLNSANSLLKILEEPPQNTVFILLSYDLNRVIATIKSRCYKYNLSSPNLLFVEDLESSELEIALSALSRPSVENIYALSKLVDSDNFAFFIEFVGKWLTDLTSVTIGGKINYCIEQQTVMQGLSVRVNKIKVMQLHDKIVDLMPWGTHTLNHKLQIENLLFAYQSIFS